jgi:cytochrome c
MRTLALLFVAALMMSLSSCGGSDKAEEKAAEATQAVEQKAEEVKQEVEQKAEEVKQEAQEATQAAASGKSGEQLFADNGCVACHKVDQKSIGPALKDIAAGYAGKEGDLVKFLKGEGEAIIDPAQFAVMQPNLEITKKMDDAGVKAIADYIMSIK